MIRRYRENLHVLLRLTNSHQGSGISPRRTPDLFHYSIHGQIITSDMKQTNNNPRATSTAWNQVRLAQDDCNRKNHTSLPTSQRRFTSTPFSPSHEVFGGRQQRVFSAPLSPPRVPKHYLTAAFCSGGNQPAFSPAQTREEVRAVNIWP